MRRLLAPALAALALIGLFAGQVSAQDNYPTRPVKIVIAFPVGGDRKSTRLNSSH